ncbi:SDR family oxidoreductase [Candidatus Neptunochlamydia vexilliferae]|nr:SDR family oxidoreductase [Candidatus Neptunochlamydia vexilliferae]
MSKNIVRRVLITGGAGFIGSHLSELLLEEGHEVIALDNLASGRVTNLPKHPNLTFVEADIRDVDAVRPHFEGVDWVFHLAALADIVPSIENPREYFEVNVDGTFNVLECAKGAKRLLYAASSSCYGIPDTYPTPETTPIRPQYPYALTKFLGEELVMHWEQVYKIPSLSLRLFNVYGPRARTTGTYGAVFGVFLTQKLNNKPLTVVGDGTQTRDFTFVKDVARAFLMGAESSASGKILNVGSGNHYPVNRIVELLNHDSVNIPKRPGEPDCTFADVSKIEKTLGFTAKTSFEEGVAQLLASIEDFRDAPLWEPESIKEATKTWFEYLS